MARGVSERAEGRRGKHVLSTHAVAATANGYVLP